MFKRSVCYLMLVLPPALVAGAEDRQERSLAAPEDVADWQQMRFGMFIHWGPVSLKGTEIGWSRGREVPVEEYDQLYRQFNPAAFNAREWVSLAKEAGMRYLVITSKHHDGFCLWDSQYTDYDIMSTPFKRDILRELSDECRRQGIVFDTYHSIIDWYHPDYLPRGAGDKRSIETADFDRYVAYLENQLREIVEKYGPLGVMWFDGEWEKYWSPERGWDLYRYVHGLQPHILVNNRVGKGRQGMEGVTKADRRYAGDFETPEQRIGRFNDKTPWETNMTICRQWAWKPDDQLKSLQECIQTLAQVVTGDGNFLLNVGPMPDGRIEPRQAQRLQEIGRWLAKYGESIYGTRGGPLVSPEPPAPEQRKKPENEKTATVPNRWWGGSTHKEHVVYLHILRWPSDTITMAPLPQKIVKHTVLTGGQARVRQTGDGIQVSVPTAQRDPIDTIVKLELRAQRPLAPVPIALLRRGPLEHGLLYLQPREVRAVHVRQRQRPRHAGRSL